MRSHETHLLSSLYQLSALGIWAQDGAGRWALLRAGDSTDLLLVTRTMTRRIDTVRHMKLHHAPPQDAGVLELILADPCSIHFNRGGADWVCSESRRSVFPHPHLSRAALLRAVNQALK